MRTLIITAILTLVLASSAFARSFPLDVNTLETYLNGQGGNIAATYESFTGTLSGNYDVTAIAFEAGDTNTLTTAGGDLLFTNNDTSNWGTYATGVELATSVFTDVDTATNFTLDNATAVRIYQLTENWTAPTLGLDLTAGTLLIGLNDNGSSDGDFDDIILAATPTATPIPAAAWLLGSGLLGLIGIRRRS